MNHDYYFSIVAKQIEKDFFKEIHGVDFDHRNNLPRRNVDLKGKQRVWDVRIISKIKKAWSVLCNKFFIHSGWLLKRNRT